MFDYNEIIRFVILVLTVFSLSSMILFTEGFKWFRDICQDFFERFKKFKYFKFVSHLKWLTVCQLCISFWITLILEQYLIDFDGLFIYLCIAFSVAGLSWFLGAITQFFLWGTAFLRVEFNV